MKIVFTGGGTGGHFYPLIAIAEAVRELVAERHLVPPKLYFFAPEPYDEESLFANDIAYVKIPSGKIRRYFSLQNVTDAFKILWGIGVSIGNLFSVYPDVVISKGGFGSVPVVIAAKLLDIPVIIHESDSKPGRANLLAAHFADRIGIAFESSAKYFPKSAQGKLALVGIPIRREVAAAESEGARQELGLEPSLPTVFIFGGSTGSARINETVLGALPDLVAMTNVIHQTGKAAYADVDATAKAELRNDPNASHYHPFAYLNAQSIRRAAGAADVIVARAGSTSIAEISLWKKPAILIPIPESVSHDQRTNAYTYAHTGAAIVLEESNLTPHLLASEIRRIVTDKPLATQMAEKGATFMPGDAAKLIAEEALRIGLSHEPVQVQEVVTPNPLV
ncbi:MAG TPA: UDP-N-acetylglucosamine--N-acetylmuramyl-(pentapeptide) pyrophosphoryl-undecaprenol N-acetylglucosamine transferase [Candidatus Paceibacterota bacterium]|nr:UDP-N-acetylglucosamine--N-acetylmuramyl-(pentapeptide) pyrophosphoryl-undecaprenol N-acetylglucosamine transferase [Candidatus Paceibacterota bacterium]